MLIDSVTTTAVDQTIKITPGTVGMSNLCALMIVSFTNSVGVNVSSHSYIQGETSGKVLFETIQDTGGSSVAITYLFSILKGTNTGAYSAGVCYNRNDSTTVSSKYTSKSGVQFNTIVNIDLVFTGRAGSTATVYGLLK